MSSLTSPLYGPTGDASYTIGCTTGGTITEVWSRAGDSRDSIGIVCSNGHTDYAGLQNPMTTTLTGVTSFKDSAGFSGGYVRSNLWLDGVYLDGVSGLTKLVGDTGGSQGAQFNCPVNTTLLQLTGTIGSAPNGARTIMSTGFVCGNAATCSQPSQSMLPECSAWCLAHPSACLANSLSYCSTNLDQAACQTYMRGLSAADKVQADPIISAYCTTDTIASLSAAGNQFCGCFEKISSAGIPAAIYDALVAQPLCNPDCTAATAYQQSNVGSACSANISVCIQSINNTNYGAQSAGTVNLSASCAIGGSSGTDTSTGTGNGGGGAGTLSLFGVTLSLSVWIGIAVASVLFIFLLVVVLLSGSSTKRGTRKSPTR